MPGVPNKLSQFWKELKRRKVLHVITVYASASFVIIELINNVLDALNLPERLPTIVIVILAVGFPFAVILSWIFDVTTKGVEKTKPLSEIQESEIMTTPNSWKIATYASVAIIIGLISFNILIGNKISIGLSVYGKSIAVLPFINDSPDKENEYFINGTMEDILDNLCKIEDLRVVSRTSVEQYRDELKPIPDIAEEMNVSYVLEGSCQKHENKIKLTIQLIDAINDKHIWSRPYQREIGIDGYFELQSEIAHLVAQEIQATITPEEEILISKRPTENISAYDFYKKGKEEEWKFLFGHDRNALRKAEEYYRISIEFDSKFAKAHCGLGYIFGIKYMYSSSMSRNLADSALMYLNKSLEFDPQLSEAYVLRGRYFYETGRPDQAIEDYNRAIEFNPNNWMAYQYMGTFYYTRDVVKSIENYHNASIYNRGAQLPFLLRNVAYMLNDAGITALANQYLEEAFSIDLDSFLYLEKNALAAEIRGEYKKAADLYISAYKFDTTYIEILHSIGNALMLSKEYELAQEYFVKWLDRISDVDNQKLNTMGRVGFVYEKNGFLDEADFYYNKQLEYINSMKEMGTEKSTGLWIYFDYAGLEALQGNKGEAIENLRLFNQREKMPLWLVSLINNDPFFSSIKDDNEFIEIRKEIEAKHFAESQRVKKWLEENDLLQL